MTTYKVIKDNLGVTCYYEKYETEVIPTFNYARCGQIHSFAGNKKYTKKVDEGYYEYSRLLKKAREEGAMVELL